MKYAVLVWAALWRRKARTILTVLSIAIAFLLFGLLQGINKGMDRLYADLNVDRLYVLRRIGMNDGLPLSQLERIKSVPGVSAVTHWSYVGGFYRNAHNSLPAFAVDAASHFKVYPKIGIAPEQIDALVHTRTGAIISKEIAARYGWKTGDRVPLQSSIWTKKDGSDQYPVDIVGIMDVSAYNAGSFPQFLINFEYLNEERGFAKDFVLFYVVKTSDPMHGTEIAGAIDAQFANSGFETATQTEQMFAQAQIKQVGDINAIANSIVGAVLFTLLFLTANTMTRSVRERFAELGVLKALGYSNKKVLALVMSESTLMCCVGALLGLGLARIAFIYIGSTFGVQSLAPTVVIGGITAALILALVSGGPPGWRATRISVVDALANR